MYSYSGITLIERAFSKEEQGLCRKVHSSSHCSTRPHYGSVETQDFQARARNLCAIKFITTLIYTVIACASNTAFNNFSSQSCFLLCFSKSNTFVFLKTLGNRFFLKLSIVTRIRCESSVSTILWMAICSSSRQKLLVR